MATRTGLRVGDEVVMYVPLPMPDSDKARFCRLDGRVAWTGNERTGIAFSELPIDSLIQLSLGISAIAIGSGSGQAA